MLWSRYISREHFGHNIKNGKEGGGGGGDLGGWQCDGGSGRAWKGGVLNSGRGSGGTWLRE